jgi:hypothetical protein
MRASPWQKLRCRQFSSEPSARVTSGVNGVLKRKVVSTQWDIRARPAKRQHRRCIGCEKDLASFLCPSTCPFGWSKLVTDPAKIRIPAVRLPRPCGIVSEGLHAGMSAGGQQKRHRHWIKHSDKRQGKQPDRPLKVGGRCAHHLSQISQRADVGLLAPTPRVDPCFLDLQAGERLGLMLPLRRDLGTSRRFWSAIGIPARNRFNNL